MSPDFWETVTSRRSIRRYLNKPVPSSMLKKIISAAADTPSAHNLQPWHFVVVTSAEIRTQLIGKMAEKYCQDMIVQGVQENIRKNRMDRSLKLFGNAPVIIVPYLTKDGDELEEVLSIQSTAVAIGYLLLAATAGGLGACWYAAPLFCPEMVNKQLRVSVNWRPQALITLGYPDESVQPKVKRALKDTVTYV
jgi:F420 biosynthesis protein FbiB-like protein